MNFLIQHRNNSTRSFDFAILIALNEHTDGTIHGLIQTEAVLSITDPSSVFYLDK